jgi:membrane associated rhomboid family serine protease
LPAVIAALAALIAVVSIAAAVGDRNGISHLTENGVLIPDAVTHGQVWRLFTYPLFELSPLSLVLACAMLLWFGRDLVEQQWGARRFLGTFFGLAALGGVAACVVGLASSMTTAPELAGSWPVIDGLIIAWALTFPRREVRLYGVVRVAGRWMVHIVIGGTVLYALYAGFAPFVPHFTIQLGVLLWLGAVGPWRQRRRRDRLAQAARGEAWSFERWYQKENQRRRRSPIA